MRQSLAAGWHEGFKATREDVENVTNYPRGAIDLAEYFRRAKATVRLAVASATGAERRAPAWSLSAELEAVVGTPTGGRLRSSSAQVARYLGSTPPEHRHNVSCRGVGVARNRGKSHRSRDPASNATHGLTELIISLMTVRVIDLGIATSEPARQRPIGSGPAATLLDPRLLAIAFGHVDNRACQRS
nr:hypothetical protein [Plantibacter flavus]